MSQEVPEVRIWGQSIPVSGSSVRLSIINPHFHEMRRCNPGTSSASGYSHYELQWAVCSLSLYIAPAQRRVKSNTPTSLHRLLKDVAHMWGFSLKASQPPCYVYNGAFFFSNENNPRLYWCLIKDLRHTTQPESACYVTIRAHCSIMLHKIINKIYIPLLLKTHFKPPSSIWNNFRLLSDVCFGHVMLLKYMSSESEQRLRKREGI